MWHLLTGEIHLIIGPMFSGKTTALLQRVAEEESMGRNVVLIKSRRDTRFSENNVVSHGGLSRSCTSINRLEDFYELCGEERWSKLDAIAIDEAQFIPDLVSFCASAAELHGKRLFVAGLDGDFERRRFGQVLELVPMSDTVVKLMTRCSLCENKSAIFSMRRISEHDAHQELVGGAEAYMPVCRACYTSNTSEVTHIGHEC